MRRRGFTLVEMMVSMALVIFIMVLFNRGMAALFLNRAKEARPLLSQAVEQLSEDDGWHHLGRLYLALAEMRS